MIVLQIRSEVGLRNLPGKGCRGGRLAEVAGAGEDEIKDDETESDA
jgi:hypothetical protein